MIAEDFYLKAFQTQITTIFADYFASHPQDLYNEALRKRIIEAVTQSLGVQHSQQADRPDQSISQTYYFESLGRTVESDDEVHHLLFGDASINQDGDIGLVREVKQESQQSTKNEHLNYDEYNDPRLTTTIGAILSRKQRDLNGTNQSLEGNMVDETTTQCKRPKQKGIKLRKGKDKTSETHFEDDDSVYESYTFEHNQSEFDGKSKKNHSQKLSRKPQVSHPNKPKSKRPTFPQMEEILISWIKINRQRRIVVSHFEIRKEAMRILEKLEKSKHPYFRASKGWLEKFFKRNKEVYQLLSRERHKSHVSTDATIELL